MFCAGVRPMAIGCGVALAVVAVGMDSIDPKLDRDPV
jgi:hypothetical protein